VFESQNTRIAVFEFHYTRIKVFEFYNTRITMLEFHNARIKVFEFQNTRIRVFEFHTTRIRVFEFRNTRITVFEFHNTRIKVFEFKITNYLVLQYQFLDCGIRSKVFGPIWIKLFAVSSLRTTTHFIDTVPWRVFPDRRYMIRFMYFDWCQIYPMNITPTLLSVAVYSTTMLYSPWMVGLSTARK
jgi:hypothetical protein